MNEVNTHPKKKQGPDQIVRKVKKKKPKGEKLTGSPHRSLCPRHKKIKYHLSSVDDDDMTDSKLSPKSIGFLYVSTDPRRAGQTAGGESFILTIVELSQNTLRDTKEHGRPTNLTDNSPGGIPDNTI